MRFLACVASMTGPSRLFSAMAKGPFKVWFHVCETKRVGESKKAVLLTRPVERAGLHLVLIHTVAVVVRFGSMLISNTDAIDYYSVPLCAEAKRQLGALNSGFLDTIGEILANGGLDWDS